MNDVVAYGSWPSPIGAAWLAQAGVSLDCVTSDGDSVCWTEGRPTEGGRYVVVRDGVDITPEGFNVRTRVHEYGGGASVIHRGTLYFVNFADQRLYRQGENEAPCAITPEPERSCSERYADMAVSPDGAWIVCVRERHPEQGQPINELAILPTDGSAEPRRLTGGHDFYAAPRISPDGSQLAWITWDHPNMPWDGTVLWQAQLTSEGLSSPVRIAGGAEESIFQPGWRPDGVLHYISDRSGWWNLYARESAGDRALAPMAAEFGVAHWVFGLSRYVFLSDGRIACVYSTDGIDRLGLITPTEGLQALEMPFTSIAPARLAVDESDRLLFVGGATTQAPAAVRFDWQTGDIEVLRQSLDQPIDPAFISECQPIRFPTEGGWDAHALFYPPAHARCVGPEDARPPLVVFSHGGPTSSTHSFLKLSIQYWTSRGVAVVDVNYGGSTGYGRAYRDRLKGQWGVVDTADCINAARYLADQGAVDGQRMAIRGGSAGGYTTLCALTFHDVFGAGASYFGVADLEALAEDTHKFESRYLDQLIGPYPQAKELYAERSPVHYSEQLSCPVILFQGAEDRVVPRSQAEKMVEALDRKGLPHAYLLFEGEQHGFRKAQTIQRTLEAELLFYGQIFGFELDDSVEPVEIKNL